MANTTVNSAFAKFAVTRRNNQSRSAWTSEGALVVCVPEQDFRKSARDTMEFMGSTGEGSGSVIREFGENISKALADKAPIRLVIARTEKAAATTPPKPLKQSFSAREDVVGEVVSFDGTNYVFRFRKEPASKG